MWPIVINFLRTYAPFVTLPIAAVIGFVGYNIEGLVSDKQTSFDKSVKEAREERLMQNIEKDKAISVDSLKEHKFVPRSIFEKNVSPSLETKSP